jgi:hypothetical protein
LEDSDFNKRYSKNFGRKLSDHRYASEFKLNSERSYEDDVDGSIYEIRNIEDDSYLVFTMTVVKVSHAMDEANYYDELDVAFELMANNIDSFSKIDNFYMSLGITLLVLVLFFYGLYKWILPNHIKNVMFALPISVKSN